MSFSAEVKSEICKSPLSRGCCARAESYGVLLYCNTFTAREIRIITGSSDFAERLPKLFRRAFSLEFDEIIAKSASKKSSLVITDAEKITKIFRCYGYEASNLLAHHINLGVLEEPCCRTAFLRGAFLAGGSITAPEKGYHLELVTDHMSVSRELLAILFEMDFEPKDTTRSSNYITYFKQSEAIEDFFTLLGAPIAAMGIMNAKVEKDMRNAINRKVNCDSANADKIVSASQEQLHAIRKLDIEALPDKLQETALLRIANPEASISELAQLSDPPVTKSCLSHRLRKLMLLAK